MPHEELPSLQRPRYGCKCAGRAGSHRRGTLSPRNALEKPREPGARRGESGRAAAVWLQSWEVELQRVGSDALLLSPHISDPQLATPTLYPQHPPPPQPPAPGRAGSAGSARWDRPGWGLMGIR